MARRHDINIPRNTLCHWVNFAAETLVPLYKIIVQSIRQNSFINIDETPVTYLPKDAEGSKKGYFWIYQTKGNGVLYDWRTGRGNECLDSILTNGEEHFTGLIQCDGYSAYDTWANKRDGVTLAGCWAHARRKFREVLPYSKNAAIGLQFIQKLYDVEHQYQQWIAKSNHPPEVIIYYRGRHLKPILKDLRKELLTLRSKHLPQS